MAIQQNSLKYFGGQNSGPVEVDDVHNLVVKKDGVTNTTYNPLAGSDTNLNLTELAFTRPKDLPTTITAFRTGDVIAVDGPSGTAKMAKDVLLKETAENALVDNVVPLLNLNDPTLWIQGGVNSSTGIPDYTATSRISTELLLLSNISDVKLDTAGNVTTRTIYAYNASKTYLGYAFGSIANVKATYPTAVYYRICLIASSAITPSAIGTTVILSNLAYLNKIADIDNEISELKSGKADKTELLKKVDCIPLNLNVSSLWIQGGISSSTGDPDYTATSRISSVLLLLNDTSIVTLATPGNVTTRTIYVYDKDKAYLGYGSWSGAISGAKATYPSAVYYRVGLIASSAITPSAINDSVVFDGGVYINKFYEIDLDIADLKSGVSALNATTYGTKNAVDLNDSTNWELGGANIENGEVFTTPIKRFHTNLLKLSDSSVWSFVDKDDVGNFGMLCYDAYGNYLGWKFGTYSVASCRTSFPNAVWFRLYCVSDSDKSLTDIGTNVVFGTSDMSSQNDDGLVQRVKILESSSGGWLVGKKWVACGDSFTHGDGIYAGSRATYPFYIGNRTGMDIVDFAVNGSTLGTYSGSTTSNSFTISGGRLYQIPADADYITLYFGINDGHNAIPVGNESDSTTGTFWGALNVALGYLTLNYPNARIGVIASNGCDADGYPQAAVDAAKKWGVPYLDLDGAVGCRTMIRCRRSPASTFVKNQILQQQRVSADNTHPNSYAHELESTFIEAWLKTL